jgi:hypothetical protein
MNVPTHALVTHQKGKEKPTSSLNAPLSLSDLSSFIGKLCHVGGGFLRCRVMEKRGSHMQRYRHQGVGWPTWTSKIEADGVVEVPEEEGCFQCIGQSEKLHFCNRD